MKFIQILFSTPMVQAKQEGRKNMTRRLNGLEEVNNRPDDWMYTGSDKEFHYFQRVDNEKSIQIKSRYGQPGDVLWVRETFVDGFQMDNTQYFLYDEEGEMIPKTWYRADNDLDKWFDGNSITENIPWKPSIHMPKSACRIFLKVKSIRVERLHEISEEDAKAEGVRKDSDSSNIIPYYDYNNEAFIFAKARYSFCSLWEEINGDGSWDSNPWVWVVEFEQCDKPEGF